MIDRIRCGASLSTSRAKFCNVCAFRVAGHTCRVLRPRRRQRSAGGPAPWRARAMGSAQASAPSGSPAPGTASRRPDRSTGVGPARLQPSSSLVQQFINRQSRNCCISGATSDFCKAPEVSGTPAMTHLRAPSSQHTQQKAICSEDTERSFRCSAVATNGASSWKGYRSGHTRDRVAGGSALCSPVIRLLRN